MPARILIADDYEDNRELLRLILLAAEYEVLEARDGEECVTLAQHHVPELIMVDLSMPKLDGWEVLKALRADRRTRDVPCVAVTAYAEIDRNRALEAGFNSYLSKPFRVGELLEVVAHLMAARALQVSTAEAGGGEI
jgi:two-component system cell cycle response regulator DivK